MKRTIKIIGLVLAVATIIACVSVFANGITYPCTHSYAESYAQPSFKQATARTNNSKGGRVVAQVKGTYRVNGGNAVNFAGPTTDQWGAATSTYTSYASGTVTFPTCYNYYTCECPTCGTFWGGV